MSAKYPESKNPNLAQIAESIRRFWEENNIFEQSISNRKGAKPFVFYEGPPSANGTPGIHHVMGRTVKDLFCRYKTLSGHEVKRKGGWDTHGLPVELQVEKQLGITKEDIGTTISIEDYNRKCREAVMLYKDQWDDLTRKMGYWVDLDHPYITYENNYIETLWWLLSQLYERNLLYKGYTIQPYSPAAGTGLSSHELNLPGCYRLVKDTSIVAQFKVKRDAKSEQLFAQTGNEVFLLAWTTTPWTLPSNSALVVGDKMDYVLVDTYNQYTHKPISVVLAKELLSRYFHESEGGVNYESYKPGDKAIPYVVKASFKGSALVGIGYEQLIDYVQPLRDADKAFHVIAGDFVTTDEGTGIVHASPTFGADDYRVAKQHGIPPVMVLDAAGNEVPTVDKKGKFVTVIGRCILRDMERFHIKSGKSPGPDDFFVKNYTDEDESNHDYKSTDVILSIILKEENKAFRVEKYEHMYPHCWRTDKPVLYYPLDSWFIRSTAVKDRMVALNRTINWKPASTGTGRFGNWLENLVDWNLSRTRYWGTPLPIWRTADGSEEICIGSIAQLRAEVEKAVKAGFMAKSLGDDIDLHRPYVDNIVLVSAKGEKMFREQDLIDVWFDSGAMPYAQWHYPFDNKDLVDKGKFFPADFIAEGVDQTRGWFFTLHAIAALLFDSVAFKNVVSNGLILDKDGNKMSKRKGNVVDPFKAIEEYGPDVVRWYMMDNAPPWENLKFDFDAMKDVQRKLFATLTHTYAFFALYANIDGFVKDEFNNVGHKDLTVLDHWILSKLQSLVATVRQAYDDFEPTKAARAMDDFVNDHLSNWYVRLNRKRFWEPASRGELSTLKKGAYETLYHCLMVVSQLMSPLAPFYADWLYKNLTDNIRERAVARKTPLRHVSVHLTDLVEPEKKLVNKELEEGMDCAQRISSLLHSIRKEKRIKVRTPLKKLLIPVLNGSFVRLIDPVKDIILTEVNVKEIEFIDDASGLLVKKAKPNYPKLGKEYGSRVKDVAGVIQSLTSEQLSALESKGKLSAGGFDLTPDDVLVTSEDIPGWAVASDGELTVALDVTLNDELRREGIARDLVNRIQNLRKDMGLEVLDKIRIEAHTDATPVLEALTEFSQYIRTETQASTIDLKSAVTDGVDVDLDDYRLKVKIEVNG